MISSHTAYHFLEIAHGYKIFKEKQEDCVKVVLNPWA